MVSLAIEVQDMAAVQPLMVMPSAHRAPTQKEMAAFVSRLAPIEMAAPSITSGSRPPPGQSSRTGAACEPAPAKQLAIHGWVIPLAYVTCGLLLCMGNVLVPHGVVACAHVLAPLWTLTLAAHAVAAADPAWMWLGALVALMLPFVLLVRDPLFVCFYLAIVAAFGSGRFWAALHGPAFVAVCVAWFGLAAACVLAALSDHPRAQLSVAAFFALACAIVNSAARFGRLVLHVG
jgi:hypothetical protein